MVNGKIPGTVNLLLIMGALVFLVELVAAWRARSWAGIPKTLLWTIALPLALYLIAPLVVGKTTPFWIDVLFSMILVIPLGPMRSEEQTSELQSLLRHSYAVFC